MKKKEGIITILLVFLTSIFIVGFLVKVGIRKYSKESWTIFMYLCGTDLETSYGYASENINELLGVDIDKDITYIIQTGGTKNWDNNYFNPEKSQTFIIKDHKLKLLKETELKNMGKSGTLTDFLTYGFDNYKADNYGLIFWNHGGGSIGGVAYDEVFNKDSLQLNEVRSSLKYMSSKYSNKFEFIGFDCCLMSSIETASVLQPYSNYMIASQEFEPGCGWSYSNLLNYLNKNLGANGKEIGKVICDSYYDKCSMIGAEDMSTLSVIDLSEIPDLIKSIDIFSREVYTKLSDKKTLKSISQGVLNSEKYGGNTEDEGFSNYIDIGELMYNMKYEIKDVGDDVLDDLNAAICYSKNGRVRSKANGLSMYYPLHSNLEDIIKYQDIAVSNNYRMLVEKCYSELNKKKDNNLIKIDKGPYINEDAYYEMIINPKTMEYVHTLSFSLYYKDKNLENTRIYLGDDTDLDVDYNNGRVTDNFRGEWPAINNQFLNMTIVEEADEYVLYTVPILLNGKETNLRISWVWDKDDTTGAYKILGVWDGVDTDTGMSSRNVKKLKNGDRISLKHIYYDEIKKEHYEVIGEEIVVDDNTKIEDKYLDPGIYYYNFNIIDVFGSIKKTDSTEFEVGDDGYIYVERPQ